MLEVAVPFATAAITGMAVLTQRVHNRINDLDKRLDNIELDIVQQYVTKGDLAEVVDRMSTQMLRIEDKIDRIVMTIPNK